MLIGIAIVLIIITRSLLNTIFIIGSLLLAYFASLGISEQISAHVLHVDSLSWNVPFFSFIMIVALGVDYSIFVMMRYNEIEGDSVTKIVTASRHIGGVVLSAALILGDICSINSIRCINTYTSCISSWRCTSSISFNCDADIITGVNRVNE